MLDNNEQYNNGLFFTHFINGNLLSLRTAFKQALQAMSTAIGRRILQVGTDSQTPENSPYGDGLVILHFPFYLM